MGRSFNALLESRWEEGKFLCVGLDTDIAKVPEVARKGSIRETIVAFNTAIIDATKDVVCAFKPNSAFYEAYGEEGCGALRETIVYIQSVAPDVPVILDAKRADIGNTNEGYAIAAFDYLGADAITVHPYLGSKALAPLFARADKGIIVLCKTSNEGAGEVQDMDVGGEPLYLRIARLVATHWNKEGNCALVAGATYPQELARVRTAVGRMPILIPGVGAQGGDVAETVAAGKDDRGRGMIISASRSVLFASAGADFPEAARLEAKRIDGMIRSALQSAI